MSSSEAKVTKRSKRRQQQRRLKRDVLQNTMLLRGWMPTVINAQYGIYNASAGRLVLRKWGQTPTASDPLGQRGIAAWQYQCIESTLPFNGKEVPWNEIQLRWIFALRAAAIQKGWMEP